MAVKKRQSFDVMLGLFVALGLILLVAIVFVIGRERRLFDTRVDILAHFPNVAGLAVGADVMLAGVVVGHVGQIKFPKLRSDVPGLVRDVTIIMKISRRSMGWIREDSIARIDSKGLLGDKLINISIGSPELPQVQAGGMLQSTPPVDFNKALQQAQEILGNVTETVAEAKEIFKGFSAQGGDTALAQSAKSVQRILKEVESGQGVLHELIFDKKSGEQTKLAIEQSKETITKLNDSFASLSILLKEIKDGSGVLHELIYAKDQGNFLNSLNKAAKDIETMTAEVKAGQGSLGLLLKDPSLYNGLYELLGNLKRNWVLKSVIRYGISQPAQ